MSITILCQSCQRTLRVPDDLLGQAVRCPNCSHTFIAPETVEAVPHPVSAPRPERKFDDEPRPPKLADHDDGGDEDRGNAPLHLREKPGKVQAIAIMILVGGILACIWGVGSMLFSGFACCLWPGSYYSLVMGIMAVTRGANLLGDRAYRVAPPQGIATMMIINIINGDAVNLTLGIIVMVFLSDREVKAYFRS